MHTYILLDRSGSMAGPRWAESLGAINSYVKNLDVKDAKVTVAVFDSDTEMRYQIIRHSSPAREWKHLTADEVHPNGGTPLLEAIIKSVHDLEFINDPKSVLIIVTDGGENSSKHVKKEQAKSALDRIKARDWAVMFIGADFDAFGEAAMVGVQFANTINTVQGSYGATMNMAAMKTRAYQAAAQGEGAATMDWAESERDVAAGKKS